MPQDDNTAKSVLRRVQHWAQQTTKDIKYTDLHLFGSLIYKDGSQFGTSSDIDLVLNMKGNRLNASQRTSILKEFKRKKQQLELLLLQDLRRNDAGRPIVSTVAITDMEKKLDVHKAKSNGFFSNNVFFGLTSNVTSVGLLGAGTNRLAKSLDLRDPIAYAQEIRNLYLAVSANGTDKWEPEDDGEPLGKSLQRMFAILEFYKTKGKRENSKFDIAEGLESAARTISALRDQSAQFEKLQEWISVRRNARGRVPTLSLDDHLLLHEIMFDKAQDIASQSTPIVLKNPSIPIPRIATVKPKRKASAKILTNLSKASINGYKLFFHRKKKNLSPAALGKLVGLGRSDIRELERVKRSAKPGPACFSQCKRIDLAKIEKVLDCVGELEYGKGDDFLTIYLMFYKANRGDLANYDSQRSLDYHQSTKAVIFDFGGTITKSNGEKNTWEKMWSEVGYSMADVGLLHHEFVQRKISHQEWCDKTCDKLRERKFSKKNLSNVANTIELIPGTKETFQILEDRGIPIYIVSGSLRQIITQKISGSNGKISQIQANEIIFDHDGVIKKIRGTAFDFEGKASFVKRVIGDLNCDSLEILYVGNSLNDHWVSKSGCRTLCVNPSHTDYTNTYLWTNYIPEMMDLREILRYV